MASNEDPEKGHSIDSPPPPYQPETPNYGAGDTTVPPSYENIVDPTGDFAMDPDPERPPTETTPVTAQPNAPPSYDSLYGKVKAAKKESGGKVDFFKRFMVIVCGTIGCTICVGLVMAIPISMIAMGSIYLYDCTIERFIPIYLIVGGCFGILKNVSNIVQRIRNKNENKEEENARTNPFDGIVSCFLLAWFIAGNVWIYHVYGLVNYTNTKSPQYCNQALYLYAFWITTATYIFLALMCFCICCAGLITMCFGD